jgi:hypothetical protein
MKHQMINGDIWVRCLRCGKTWNPPVREELFLRRRGKASCPEGRTFNRALFEKAIEDYKRATMFETNNSMSTSVQCRFSHIDPETGVMIDAADSIARTSHRPTCGKDKPLHSRMLALLCGLNQHILSKDSTWETPVYTLQNLVDIARTRGDIAPALPTGGSYETVACLRCQ